MPFNPYEPESDEERESNAKSYTRAEVNAGAYPAGTPAHYTKIRRAGGLYVAVCSCLWRSNAVCYTPGIAQAEAERHIGRAA
jgi:hypothetical protein